jgi:1-acyl-sn-glycerol-3-phosphate acyltransferase
MKKARTSYRTGWAKFCGWLLRRLGWTTDNGPAPEKKVIMLGVPHTSIWDFIISYLFYTQFGKVAHVMVKKEFFVWPFKGFLRGCGGIPVDRSSTTSMLKSLIEEMEGAEEFHLAIAPEGTRKPVKRWKSGYHLIAKETGAVVYMSYFDWGTKHIGIGEKVELTDDAKADTKRIQDLYEQMHLTGKNKKGYITH